MSEQKTEILLSEKLKKKTPTAFDTFFKSRNFSRGAIAAHMGLSFSYTCNMLNGCQAMPDKTRAKFQAVMDQILAEEAGR